MKRIINFTLILALFVLIFAFASCNKKGTAQIDILKIGKADCIVVNTGTEIIMIDTGEQENLNTVHNFMDKKGYCKINTLIITHYDKDHIGGASDIISKYNVEQVIESSFTSNNQLYKDYHNAISNCGATLKKLDENYEFSSNGSRFLVNVPKNSSYKTDKSNNSSLVISMNCGNKKLLFCGDALETRMSEIINEHPGRYDLVKLPHHGTCLENYTEILNELQPSYAVITSSNKNPSDEDTRQILYEYSVKTYETRYGTVNIKIDENGLNIVQ